VRSARTLILVVVLAAVSGAVGPRVAADGGYTGSVSFTYDSWGHPTQAFLVFSGPVTSDGFQTCVSMVQETKPDYNDFNYPTTCHTFKFASSGTTTSGWGKRFPWGGPAEYEVTWSVPPGGTVVSTATFKWANTNGTFAPCPPDPLLQRAVWVPSRLKVLDRCKTVQNTVYSNYSVSGSGDNDYGWAITYKTDHRHVEYMISDIGRLRPTCAFDCSMPTKGETWKLTGVYVCDTYHGWKEFHPVFMAQEIVNGTVARTLLAGPQYSTKIWQGPYPTFTKKSCP
jgi:hypothetical protein